MKSFLKDFIAPIVAKPIVSRIHKFKDIHRGESCYLIGGGISIKWFNLATFSDMASIPCQFIPFHRDFCKLNVEHVVFPEPYYFLPFHKNLRLHGGFRWNVIQKEYRKIISDNLDKNFYVNLSNYLFLNDKNIYFLYRDLYDSRLSEDSIFAQMRTEGGGSLVQSILLAIYLGYHKVYLVGFDYTHVPSRSLHWIEKGEGIFAPPENYSKFFFEIAKQYVDITTITIDGTSDYIEAVTYKEHTGDDPLFKENTELLDEKYLRALATWPDYTIY